MRESTQRSPAPLTVRFPFVGVEGNDFTAHVIIGAGDVDAAEFVVSFAKGILLLILADFLARWAVQT
jgi:hypothetical protein